jgi:TRAP-type uncharacterized transport system fused permease subunit
MRTGLEAMRLGSIIYFIPFFFVLNPSLILQGTLTSILAHIASAFVGVWFVAGALQGYQIGIGPLSKCGALQWPVRALMVFAGMSLATPGGGLLPWTNMEGMVASVVMLIAAAVLFFLGSTMLKNGATQKQ